MPGAVSKQKIGSGKLHIEFRVPYQPNDEGQSRGKGNCYLQGRYELRILDSFGLDGNDSECGGLFSVRNPTVNMCLPPLTWQTFDIDFTAATYGADGKVAKPARITVQHNGVTIHDDVELPQRTPPSAPVAIGPDPGPLHLQDLGSPIRFRNIWFAERR
jgi:hypothetical protein